MLLDSAAIVIVGGSGVSVGGGVIVAWLSVTVERAGATAIAWGVVVDTGEAVAGNTLTDKERCSSPPR